MCLISAAMMSWVGCLLTNSELFILCAENDQIILKISVIPILLTFIYMLALNLLVNNQLNSSLRQKLGTMYFILYFQPQLWQPNLNQTMLFSNMFRNYLGWMVFLPFSLPKYVERYFFFSHVTLFFHIRGTI